MDNFIARSILLSEKIKLELAKTDKLPADMFELGVWMFDNLGHEFLRTADEVETRLGWDGANRWLTQVLVESGFYKSDDGQHIELKETK